MIATIHACQRFLERVILMKEYNRDDIKRARAFLENDFKDFKNLHVHMQMVLPSFPTMIAVIDDEVIVTIKPKRPSLQKRRKDAQRAKEKALRCA